MVWRQNELVVTGLVAPVCKEFEDRFEASEQDLFPNPIVRFLSVDRENRRLYLVKEVLEGAIVFVTKKSPRTGRIAGGRFNGFVVRQVSQTEFMIARPFNRTGIELRIPFFSSDELWDPEYLDRKKEVPFGETLILDLGER